jgi:hypothetical protein
MADLTTLQEVEAWKDRSNIDAFQLMAFDAVKWWLVHKGVVAFIAVECVEKLKMQFSVPFRVPRASLNKQIQKLINRPSPSTPLVPPKRSDFCLS